MPHGMKNEMERFPLDENSQNDIVLIKAMDTALSVIFLLVALHASKHELSKTLRLHFMDR